MARRKKTSRERGSPITGPTIFSGIPHLNMLDQASAQMVEVVWVRPFIMFATLWKVMLTEAVGMSLSRPAGQW